MILAKIGGDPLSTYTPVLPLQNVPAVKKGVATAELCNVCHEPMRTGQLFSGVRHSKAPPLTEEGVRVSDEGYFEGHYNCVVKALGPEETLLAIQQKRLAMIDPGLLVDGCLPLEHGGI